MNRKNFFGENGKYLLKYATSTLTFKVMLKYHLYSSSRNTWKDAIKKIRHVPVCIEVKIKRKAEQNLNIFSS